MEASKKPIRVAHDVNQFFAGRGGEEIANAPVEVVAAALGPARLLEPLPEAVAVVSTGIGRPGLEPLALPAPARVLGGPELMATWSKAWERIPSNSPLTFHRWTDHYGFGDQSGFEY